MKIGATKLKKWVKNQENDYTEKRKKRPRARKRDARHTKKGKELDNESEF